MKTQLILIGLVTAFFALTTYADSVSEPEVGNEHLQFVYSYTGSDLSCPCNLIAATIVTTGNDAQKLFNALSAAYPKLVTKEGRLGLQPEIDLANLACGLQVISHGPGPVTPEYQCYTSVDLPAK